MNFKTICIILKIEMMIQRILKKMYALFLTKIFKNKEIDVCRYPLHILHGQIYKISQKWKHLLTENS